MAGRLLHQGAQSSYDADDAIRFGCIFGSRFFTGGCRDAGACLSRRRLA
jgi:hypothetical protein